MAVITIKVVDRKGDTLTEKSAPEQVSLVYDGLYQEGDIILVETDRPQQFCVVHLEDTMPPALVFLPGGAMEFPIPPADNRMNYNPRSFVGRRHLLSARCAAAEELKGPRNLAFNPYDCHGENGMYPHASANVETRGEAVFAARNAVDGFFENDSHGEWPYQSWGINRDTNAAMKLEFGRPVRVKGLRLTLRADFPHDSWWTRVTVRFSDGSQERLALEKTALPQKFDITPRVVNELTLCELIKAEDESPFPALTQIEVGGEEYDADHATETQL